MTQLLLLITLLLVISTRALKINLPLHKNASNENSTNDRSLLIEAEYFNSELISAMLEACIKAKIPDGKCSEIIEETRLLFGAQEAIDIVIPFESARVREAIEAELGDTNSMLASVKTSSTFGLAVDHIGQVILSTPVKATVYGQINRGTRRIAFIHSCLLNSSGTRILQSMLDDLVDSQLMNDSLDFVFVLNYGSIIPTTIMEKYTFARFLQISNETSAFELPTLSLLKEVVDRLPIEIIENTQILYVHTKGVSYQETNENVEAWRKMMLYFLVHEHKKCFYLLRSGLFDVIGSQYGAVFRVLHGNFWWTTGKLISELSWPLFVDKYTAESFVLSTRNTGEYTKVFVPYASDEQLFSLSIDENEYRNFHPKWNYYNQICKNQNRNQNHYSFSLYPPTMEQSSRSFLKDIHCIGFNVQ